MAGNGMQTVRYALKTVPVFCDGRWQRASVRPANQHWHKQNARKKKSLADGLPNRHSSPVSVSMATGG